MLYALYIYNGNGESTLSVLCPTIADVFFWFLFHRFQYSANKQGKAWFLGHASRCLIRISKCVGTFKMKGSAQEATMRAQLHPGGTWCPWTEVSSVQAVYTAQAFEEGNERCRGNTSCTVFLPSLGSCQVSSPTCQLMTSLWCTAAFVAMLSQSVPNRLLKQAEINSSVSPLA